MKRRAKIEVTMQAIAEAMGFPPDHRIVHIDTSGLNWEKNQVTMYLEGPSLPVVREGEQCQLVEYRAEWERGTEIYGAFITP